MSRVPAGARARLGRGPAAIQLFSKGDFDRRLTEMEEGRAPRDFFYGFLGLVEGLGACLLSHGRPLRP